MIQNHRKILNLLVFALILIFSGCALNSLRGPIQLSSNSQIEVVSAAARSKPGGIAIYGDVRRRDGQAKSVPGHLHFVATDDAGRVIAMTDAPWGEFMSRRLRRAYYTAFLSIDRPSTTTTISIAVVLNAQS